MAVMSEKSTDPSSQSILQFARAVCADAALALIASVVAALVIASLAAAGIITMSLSYFLLGLSWIVAVGGSFLVPWPLQHKHRAIFAVFLAAMLILIGWFETEHYEQPMSAKEIVHEIIKSIGGAGASVPRLNDASPESNSTPLVLQAIPNKAQIILDVTPDYLMDLYKDRMSIQSDKLAQIYIGKLISISGHLREVYVVGNNNGILVSLVTKNRKDVPLRATSLFFKEKWKERLEVMTKNNNISAVCEIKTISFLFLSLDNCDLRD